MRYNIPIAHKSRAKIEQPAKNCSVCGTPFNAFGNSRKRKTCSDACAESIRGKTRTTPKRKPDPIRAMGRDCPDCGAPVIRRNHSAKYCFDCAAKRIEARNSIYKPKHERGTCECGRAVWARGKCKPCANAK